MLKWDELISAYYRENYHPGLLQNKCHNSRQSSMQTRAELAFRLIFNKMALKLITHRTLDNFNKTVLSVAVHLFGAWLVNSANEFAGPLDCLITCDQEVSFPTFSQS